VSAARAVSVQSLHSRASDLLSLDSAREGDVHYLSVYGEIDLSTAELLDHELRRAEGGDAAAIVVDLSGLDFLDSYGLRVLVAADVRSRTDGQRLRLLRGPEHVDRVFAATGLSERLPFLD
jgi:anti-sigma B factor antagonist